MNQNTNKTNIKTSKHKRNNKTDPIWDLPNSGVSLGDPKLSKKVDFILYDRE